MAAVTVGLAGLVRGRTVAAFVLAGLGLAGGRPYAGCRGSARELARPLTQPRSGTRGAVRSLWSLLGVIAFGALFVSADALFAEWFDVAHAGLLRSTAIATARS